MGSLDSMRPALLAKVITLVLFLDTQLKNTLNTLSNL